LRGMLLLLTCRLKFPRSR
jgi:hypothetical protein